MGKLYSVCVKGFSSRESIVPHTSCRVGQETQPISQHVGWCPGRKFKCRCNLLNAQINPLHVSGIIRAEELPDNETQLLKASLHSPKI